MKKNRKDKNRLEKIPREYLALGVFLLLAVLLVGRVFLLQIINGKEYRENFQLQIRREIEIKGTRGCIYDRNGELLAGNQTVMNVVLEDSGSYDSQRERNLTLNGEICRILKILRENREEIRNELKIEPDGEEGYRYTVEGRERLRFLADIYGRQNIQDLTEAEENADANEVMEYLTGEDRFCLEREGGKPYTSEEKLRYGLPEKWSREDMLAAAGIRYMLSLKSYQRYEAVILSRAVSEKTQAAILENQDSLPGCGIREDSIRVYTGGDAFGPVLGYTGEISAEELEKARGEYDSGAIVGRSGMEQYLDRDLQGTDGIREVYVNNVGKVQEDRGIVKEPSAGDDVYLTIDKELQEQVYHILEKKIAQILLDNMINTKTFDKSSVSDASDIKIPVYDVYSALVTNHIIDLKQLKGEELSETGKKISGVLEAEKDQALKDIMANLRSGKEKRQGEDSPMGLYEDFIIENLPLEEKKEISVEAKEQWEAGEISIKEYLKALIARSVISREVFAREETYLTGEELYEYLITYIQEFLQESEEFEELVCSVSLKEDKIPPAQICLLLYEQGVLEEDEDKEALQKGTLSPWTFVRKKIGDLKIHPSWLALDPCSGSAVVTDVETGQVLACVSYPGYDSNRLANEMDTEYYYQLYHDKSVPFYNRATQQLSAPGSTFKPVTIMAGMEEGVIDASAEVFCDGVFDKVTPHLRCWNHSGHGRVSSPAAALRHSCNDYLCEVSWRLGMKGRNEYSDDQALRSLEKYAEMVGLNEKSGIELPESQPRVSDEAAIPSAIGQGTHNYSTTQLGRYAAVLASRGSVYKLSLIQQKGDTPKEPERAGSAELSPAVWDQVQEGMEQYIENTGIFDGFSVKTAGKSGTAQESRSRPDHGLFIGYAPGENPEVSVAVRITNGYTSGNAVSCGCQILECIFPESAG